jgi:hypothetical protein
MPESNTERVFIKALELEDPEARKVSLEEACGADPDLREQVKRLLAAAEGIQPTTRARR